MGVFKNEVGRPSNETIKKRNIFKLFCLILLLIIIGLVVYILNDKGIIKVKNDNEITSNKVVGEKKDLYAKYKNIDFVRTTKLDYTNYGEAYDLILYIENGKIKGESKNKKVIIKQLDSKAKYIAIYGQFYYDGPRYTIVALTEDHKVYLGDCDMENSKLEFNFEFVSDNIYELKFNENKKIGRDDLYLLDSNGNLRLVKEETIDGKSTKLVLSNELYEERIIYLGDYHQGGPWNNLKLRESDNSASFDKYDDNYDDNYDVIKYNGKQINLKNVFMVFKDNYESTAVYFVDKDNNIYTTKKEMTESIGSKNISNDCYEIMLYSNEKVKSTTIEEKKEDGTEKKYINVTYESGKIEKLELMNQYIFEEYK